MHRQKQRTLSVMAVAGTAHWNWSNHTTHKPTYVNIIITGKKWKTPHYIKKEKYTKQQTQRGRPQKPIYTSNQIYKYSKFRHLQVNAKLEIKEVIAREDKDSMDEI